MSYFDIVLLIILGGFAFFGLYSGFFRAVGSLVGSIAALYLSIRVYDPVAWWIGHYTGWSENITRVIAFVFLFFVLNRLVGLGFWLIEKIVKDVIRVPFVRSLDRILGLVLGLLEGVLALGITFYFIARFPISEWFMSEMAGSEVVPIVTQPIKVLIPLLPEALKMIRSTVSNVF